MIRIASIEFINGRKGADGKIRTYKTLSSLRKVIDYVLDLEHKTTEELRGGKNCNPMMAYDDFVLTKSLFRKLPKNENDLSRRMCIHFVQSFAPGEADAQLAKNIADEMVKYDIFNDFSVVYGVHTDKEHIHTHFIINSTSNIDGKSYQQSREQMKRIKEYSDMLCRKFGLSVIAKKEIQKDDKVNLSHLKEQEIKNSGEYRSVQRGLSWKKEMFDACKEAKNYSNNAEEYIDFLNKKGIRVVWKESRKDISYINADGKKINSDKLGQPKRGYTPFTKAALEEYWNKKYPEQINESKLSSKEQKADNCGNHLGFAKHLARLLKDDTKRYQKPSFVNKKTGSKNAKEEKLEESKKGDGIEWDY